MKNVTKAASWSASLSIVAVVILTVVGELVAPFKSFLASITGHHWVTKGVFEVAFFFVLFLIFASVFKKEEKGKPRGIYATMIVTILSGIAILLFYVLHYLGTL